MVDLLSPTKLANFLLFESRERGEVLTNLKLQKLIYYAQAWHMALKDKPLFGEDFEAWIHGPVLPSQYQRFKTYQWRPITEEVVDGAVSDDALNSFLAEIIDVFGSETAVALELMTHRETPWLQARGGIAPHLASNTKIEKAVMRDFYRALGANK